MSDKIVVMRNGLIEQVGTPTEIYNEPTNAFVADFIGESNLFEGVMKEDYLVSFGEKDYECVDHGFKPNEPVDVIIRPEDIQIKKRNEGKLNGQVMSVLFKGVHYEVIVETKKGASKTVKLNVIEDKDVFNKEANEKMHATDFTMDIEDIAELSNEELIRRSNAQAWDATTEEDISIAEVIHGIDAEPGKYPVTFKTNKDTDITVNVSVVQPKVSTDKSTNIGIQAFDVYKTVDEIKESMAISVDLINWADAFAWHMDSDNPVEIDDVRFDFDPNEIEVGSYDVTFTTIGKEYKIHTTEYQEEGKIVSIDFDKEDIHVMSKMGN